MEKYRGVKFLCRKTGDTFPVDQRVRNLHHWAWIFSQLGLTPVHPEGAYGNMSVRMGGDSFTVTKTGMIPKREFDATDFVLVESYDEATGEFRYKGVYQPSSECLLHERIYRNHGEVNALLHGHSALMIEWAGELSVPVTSKFYDYGTAELADSALEVFSLQERIIILRDHGFVAGGASIQEAGELVLERYRALLSLLAEHRA